MSSVSKRSRRLLAVSALTLLLSGSIAVADDGGLIDPPGKLQQVITWIVKTLTHTAGRVRN